MMSASVMKGLRNWQKKLKSGKNYYGQLQVHKTSDEIKSNQKLIAFI